MIGLLALSIIGGAVANHVHQKYIEPVKNSPKTVENSPPSRHVWVESSIGLTFRTIPDSVTYEEFAKTHKITTPQEYDEEQKQKTQERIDNRTPEEREWWKHIELMQQNLRERHEAMRIANQKRLEYRDPPKEYHDRDHLQWLIERGQFHRSSELLAKEHSLDGMELFYEQNDSTESFWGYAGN